MNTKRNQEIVESDLSGNVDNEKRASGKFEFNNFQRKFLKRARPFHMDNFLTRMIIHTGLVKLKMKAMHLESTIQIKFSLMSPF